MTSHPPDSDSTGQQDRISNSAARVGPLATGANAGPAAAFWIATGPKRLHGRRKLGPFVSRDLALTVRTYVEKVERRDDLWVVDGEDVPDAD